MWSAYETHFSLSFQHWLLYALLGVEANPPGFFFFVFLIVLYFIFGTITNARGATVGLGRPAASFLRSTRSTTLPDHAVDVLADARTPPGAQRPVPVCRTATISSGARGGGLGITHAAAGPRAAQILLPCAAGRVAPLPICLFGG